MQRRDSAIIDFTEAAYDLEVEDQDWLPSIVERGLPVLDQGLGVAAIEYGRPPEGGDVRILRIHVASGPDDFAERHTAALAATPPEELREQARPGQATTMSVSTADHPDALGRYTSYVDYCKDVLGLTTVDRKGAGVAIVAPLPEVTTLSARDAERWEMLAAHLDAGHRLRRGLAADTSSSELGSDLPRDTEAIFDTTSFRITDSIGEAKEGAAARRLRDAAAKVDRARGSIRTSDPDQALAMWQALVGGRWSIVDWFDSDGRRFVLGLPNPPDVTDPRGLTDRERQVVAYAVLGQTNKMIGYRLGLSKSRVSVVLRSAMRKLGVETRMQLIRKVRDFQSLK